MSMNNKPFGSNDYPDFILLNQDAEDNVFMKNRQESVPNLFPNGLPMVSNTSSVVRPTTTNVRRMPVPVENEPTGFHLDLNALNSGFAEAEGGSAYAPMDMPGQNGMIPASSERACTWDAVPTHPGLVMPSGSENMQTINYRGSINPYADYLARQQKDTSVIPGNVPVERMQCVDTTVPAVVQNEVYCNAPAQMANMTGKIVPSIYSVLNSLPAKKGMKVTAYDIMSDFIMRVPMFSYERDIFIYDEHCGYYRHTPQYVVEQMLMNMYRSVIREAGSGTLIEKVYKLLLKEPNIVRNQTPLSDPTKLSFANCTLDLNTGTLTPHSPANVVTHAINCDLARYNGSREDCPVFDKFLRDISGGDHVFEMLVWEFIGYCLTPDRNAKKYFVLQGVHDSGKSLLCNFLSDFFYENQAVTVHVHALKEKFAAKNLHHVALCISPDLPPEPLDTTSTSVVKQATGNDKISASVKYKDNIQFRFEGKLILATNYPLTTEKQDDAFLQRAVVIPFLHTIPQELQDFDLLEKLKAEKPAIASKALDAYCRLKKNHYNFSGHYEINASVMDSDAILDVPEITRLVYDFLMNRCEKAMDGLVAIETAYELFAREVSDQFTEKMFSSAFQSLAEEMYGAHHVRSYHNGIYKNARSSMKGIRFKQGSK